MKRHLDRRRREGESYNDVLERLLSEKTDADFRDGFGMLSDEQAEHVREESERSREQRKRRMERLGEER